MEKAPAQIPLSFRSSRGITIPRAMHLRAYMVYCHIWGEQKALITGDCRGGFGICELLSFLYAYPFPKEQWKQRVREANQAMEKD